MSFHGKKRSVAAAHRFAVLTLLLPALLGFNVPICICSCDCKSVTNEVSESLSRSSGCCCSVATLSCCCSDQLVTSCCHTNSEECCCSDCCVCGFAELPAIETVVLKLPDAELVYVGGEEIYGLKPAGSVSQLVLVLPKLPVRLHSFLSVWLN